MVYSKPEVTKLASAVETIQSGGLKVQDSIQDGPTFQVATPLAYEADE